jgi:ureidoacrylate peracid hydrolase
LLDEWYTGFLTFTIGPNTFIFQITQRRCDMEIRASPGAREPAVLQAQPEPIEIDLRSTAVMVIDMQNAFVSKGGFLDLTTADISHSQQIIQPVKQICEAARAKHIKVIYVVFHYSPDLREMGNPGLPSWYKEARFYHEHPEWRDRFLIRGTWGAEIVEKLRPQEGDIVIEKLKYSAFFGTALDVTLRTLDIKYLVFMGVATNICVEASLRDAYYRGYFSVLVSDATAPLGPVHTGDATIFNVMQCYGWVIGARELIRSLD